MSILLVFVCWALAVATELYDIGVRLFLYFAKGFSFSKIRTMPHETCQLLPARSVMEKIHKIITVIHYFSLTLGAIALISGNSGSGINGAKFRSCGSLPHAGVIPGQVSMVQSSVPAVAFPMPGAPRIDYEDAVDHVTAREAGFWGQKRHDWTQRTRSGVLVDGVAHREGDDGEPGDGWRSAST